MSNSILMQYLGFESKNRGREYAFQVRYAAEDVRDFTLTIADDAFTSHRIRYQDAPDVCSLKLKRELVANSDLPCTRISRSPIPSWKSTEQATPPNPRIASTPQSRAKNTSR